MRKYLFFLLLFIFYQSNAQTVSTDKNAVIHSQFRVATTNPADGSDPNKAAITIQYSDGLGRPLQTIGYQQSPNRKDIVSNAVEYDMYGRAVKSALTAPTNSSNGSFEPDPFGKANSFYGDSRSFSEITAFDKSPLNRTRVQIEIGFDWKNENKYIQTYDGSAGTDIRSYRLDANKNIILNGTYPPNSLHKKQRIDEQGHSVIEIIDLRGKIIEKQVQDDTGFIKTYFIYDPMGRILAVIQPMGYELNASIYKGTAEWDNYVFAYGYDYRGRMNRKHVPNGGEEYMVYDRSDRLILSQTAQQRQILPGETYPIWTFYKYDHLNREIMRGTFNDNATLAQVEAYIASTLPVRSYESRTTTGSLYYTLNNSYPNWVTEAQVRQVTYYDFYENWLPAGMGFDAANAYNVSSYWPRANGNVVGSRLRNTYNNEWLASVIYKDTKRRVLQIQSQNAFGQIERTDFDYNFAGEVLRLKQAKKDPAGSLTTKTKTYTYDHVGRKMTYNLALGNLNERIANYEYDEIGRQKRKVLLPNGTYLINGVKDYIIRPNVDGSVIQNNTQDIAKKAIILQPSTDLKAIVLNSYTAQINPNAASGTPIIGLQKIDYSYHIRGGILGINLDANKNPIPNATEGDLFAYKLDYQTAGYWDGNIGKQTWATQNSSTNALETRSYTHSYDVSSRLKYATYAGIGSENFSIPNMSYDKNGNITNLQRNGRLGTGTSFGAMDNLTYGYTGNRLNIVTDAISTNNTVDFNQRGTASYTYWNDGSLKSDANEQISLILYDTFLKQQKEVQLTDGRKIKHYYDGAGTLLKTIYYTTTNAILETWDFNDDFIYKNGILHEIQDDEGRILLQNGQYAYEFDYKDHLGNTRVSFKANGSNLEKTAETAFDPWGVRMNIGVVNAVQNRFEFLNRQKEATFGLNYYRLGARGYNAPTGRFDSIDPVIEGQEHLSLYQYGWNNPVRFSDPTGRCPLCGFVIGAGVDYAFQVAGNMANGKSFTESLTYKIDRNSIAISAVAGLATSGLSAIGGRGTQFVITTAIDATESVAKQINTGGVESVTPSQTFSDVFSNKMAGVIASKTGIEINTKVAKNDARRTAHISAVDQTSTGRLAKAEVAQSKLNKLNSINQASGGVVGNTIQNTSNVVRTPSGSSSYNPPAGVVKSDATNVQRPIILIRPN